MTRAIIKLKNGISANIQADAIKMDEIGGSAFLFAYMGEALRGMFAAEQIENAYLSESRGNGGSDA